MGQREAGARHLGTAWTREGFFLGEGVNAQPYEYPTVRPPCPQTGAKYLTSAMLAPSWRRIRARRGVESVAFRPRARERSTNFCEPSSLTCTRGEHRHFPTFTGIRSSHAHVGEWGTFRNFSAAHARGDATIFRNLCPACRARRGGAFVASWSPTRAFSGVAFVSLSARCRGATP